MIASRHRRLLVNLLMVNLRTWRGPIKGKKVNSRRLNRRKKMAVTGYFVCNVIIRAAFLDRAVLSGSNRPIKNPHFLQFSSTANDIIY